MSGTSPRRRGPEELAVLGLGLCTPLGLSARTTQVEMAAGTVRFFETDVPDAAGEPTRASLLTLLEPGMSRTERMASLAVTALEDCLRDVASLGLERLPLLLALPEPGSGAPFDTNELLEALDAIAGPVRLESSPDTLYPEGRAGVFHALADAARMLKARRASVVLVGGVDSLCDRESLAHHVRTGRSLGPTTRDGILPGEGAGFVLLASSTLPGLRRLGRGLAGWVVGCALAHEPHSFLQREPNLAEGLTDAFRQLRRHPVAGSRRVEHVLSCQTGESFWAQEFTYAYLRNAALMPEPLTTTLVAETLGDVGAAAGVIQLGRALHLMKKLKPVNDNPPRLLIYGCADSGPIGACVVEEDA